MSLRSTYITLAIGVALALVITAGMSSAIGASWQSQREMYASFNPTSWPFDAMLFSTIAFSVIGVSASASEYSTGMIRQTLAAMPNRGVVLAAKCLVVAVVTLVVGLITSTAMFAIAQAIYGSYGMPTAGLGEIDSLQAIVGAGIVTAVFPVLGVALGFIVRNTASAVAVVLAQRFAPALLGSLLPVWWQENVIRFLPGHAAQNVMLGHVTEGPTSMEPALALLVVASWLIAAIGVAYLATKGRDA
jgi:hypothetical protein